MEKLDENTSYIIGNFRIILKESGELNIQALLKEECLKEKTHNIMIKPIVANSINVLICK